MIYNGDEIGIKKTSANPEYMYHLFDDSYVHHINIEIEDFEAFINNASKEEYVKCDITIDNEEFKQVGLRVKGNNSRRLISEYGLTRYSLKMEFDHFVNGLNYYGLDKLSLDTSFQDNSYLKTWLVYDMMEYMEVPSPLTSYVYLTINNKEWGLFLAIEEMEESFLKRNYGNEYGDLYKPEYKTLKGKNNDIALKYIDDRIESYPNIFDHPKTKVSEESKKRVIKSLKNLAVSEDLDKYFNIDEIINYFAVSTFVMNWDSYIGYTGHNYLLYEEDGRVEILPWDYNLAFGTYALGMTNAIKDSDVIINYPINTPCVKEIMLNRPLYHNLMKNNQNLKQYHNSYKKLIDGYFESGLFIANITEKQKMIDEYIKKDPTSFSSYDDHILAYKTLIEVCELRKESIKGQLLGKYPISLSEIKNNPNKVSTKHINLEDLGYFEDLRNSKEKQNEVLKEICE